MILETLILHNFRKFNNTTIEFPEGIIGVVGLNGTGKSTIFEAIAWALYGSVAARTSSEEIKRNSAEPSASCRVELTFLFEGNKYRVVRELTGKSMTASATVTMNSKVAATGAGPSAKFIQKTLGMDFKSFFTSIFAKQKELNTLSSMNASERRPLILKMLGIDALDDVIKNINADRRTKTSLITHLEKNLIDSYGKDKIEQLKEKEVALKEKKKTAQKEITQMKNQIKTHKQQLQTQKNDVKEAKKTYETSNKEYEQLIKQKTQYEQKEKLQQEINTITQKINKRITELTTLGKKQSQFKEVTNEIKNTDTRIEEIAISITETIKKIEQKKTAMQHLKTQTNELKQKQNNVEKLGPDASCPTCERELGSQFDFLLKKYENKTELLTKKRGELEKEITIILNKKEKHQREQEALKKKKNFLSKQETEQQKINTQIKAIQKEKEREEQELLKKQKSIQQFTSITFNPSSFKILQNHRKETYQQYQKILETYNKMNKTNTTNTIELEKKHSNLALLTQQLQSLEQQKNELKKMKEQIKNEQQLISKITILRDVMGNFRLHLISRIQPALSQYASTFFHDLTDGKYVELTLDEQYNIYIYDEGQSYNIQRFSGGEIDLANLCLRLAISDVITERAEGLFHFIILDEIFGSQDTIRQQNIMEELYKLSSKFKQIFLITHVEQVKHYMQHILQVQEIDGISSVKIN